MSRGAVLVTGGAGYIGSHAALELLDAGFNVVLLDNFSNSSRSAVAALRAAANRDVPLLEGDVRDSEALDAAFREHEIEAVFHFAAAKAVGESVQRPLHYYSNNVEGTRRLVERMRAWQVKTLVYSSSAAVYGEPDLVPLTEGSPLAPANPYGRTKLAAEWMLQDLHQAEDGWRICILRYFNPIGAHGSGLLGDAPLGVPNNLVPCIGQVAVGKLPRLRVFGNDYPTPDGTGVRDYVHVVDLAKGHVKALERLARQPQLAIYNLGTGLGHSVLEVVKAFEAASARRIPREFAARRPGDVATLYADPSKAQAELAWRAELGLARMCEDVWRHLVESPQAPSYAPASVTRRDAGVLEWGRNARGRGERG